MVGGRGRWFLSLVLGWIGEFYLGRLRVRSFLVLRFCIAFVGSELGNFILFL